MNKYNKYRLERKKEGYPQFYVDKQIETGA